MIIIKNNAAMTNKTGHLRSQKGSLRGSSVNVGTIQRRLAWPLRKDDTHTSRSLHIYVFFLIFFSFYFFCYFALVLFFLKSALRAKQATCGPENRLVAALLNIFEQTVLLTHQAYISLSIYICVYLSLYIHMYTTCIYIYIYIYT